MQSDEQFRADLFYGSIECAKQTLEVTPPPHEGRNMRWANSDFYSFDAMMDLEEYIADGYQGYLPVAGWPVAHNLTDWRKALPFSDGERARLLAVRRAHPVKSKLALIVRREVSYEPVEDAGITTRISGKHLMQTWWRWRRGVSERFEGQNGPERAIRALWLAQQTIERLTAS